MSLEENAAKRGNILLAVPGKLTGIQELQDLLKSQGFSLLTAASPGETSTVLATTNLDGAVIISDWLLPGGHPDNLLKLVDNIPAVFLISQETWQETQGKWFDLLYQPSFHEYCTIPVDKNEITMRLHNVIKDEK